jgi:biotin carboxyl carrier protein
MRYTVEGQNKEWIIDLVDIHHIDKQTSEFVYLCRENEHQIQKRSLYLKKQAHVFFVSHDLKMWKRVATLSFTKKLHLKHEAFVFFRSFRPFKNSSAQQGQLLAQMPGKVIKIFVSVGQMVNAGTPLLILEAMKMENEIQSSLKGRVKSLFIQEGQNVEQGLSLMEVEPLP